MIITFLIEKNQYIQKLTVYKLFDKICYRVVILDFITKKYTFRFFINNSFEKLIMSLTLVLQLFSLLLVVSAGPIVVILLSIRGGNL